MVEWRLHFKLIAAALKVQRMTRDIQFIRCAVERNYDTIATA